MTANPYEIPETPSEAKAAGRGGCAITCSILMLFLVVGFIGILLSIFVPAFTAREAAQRRMQCSNNLNIIAMALANYEDTYHCLPPAYTVDAEGKPLHSWRTLILPFAQQQALYDQIDLSKSWDDPANRLAYESSIPLYQCPAAELPKSHTTYLAVAGTDCCFPGAESRRLEEITDDPSWTLMIVEVSAPLAVHWMSPNDANEESILATLTPAGTPHPGGTQALMAHFRVRYLPFTGDPASIRALISIAGNDEDVVAD